MKLKIGVDGGGSKTECILIDDKGHIVATHLAGGSNPSLIGAEAARSVLDGAIAQLLAKAPTEGSPPEIAATLLCMAGSDAFWRETGAQWKDRGRVVAVDDSLPVLELATGAGPGIVLHAGTGSFVAARGSAAPTSDGSAPFGDVYYAGGLGWRFGDPGSGYELGRRAIARALLELQGWKTPSGLGTLIQTARGLQGAKEITRHYYAQAKPEAQIVALAPDILKLASEGDPAAREAAVESAWELLDLALNVAKKLFPETPLPAIKAGLSGKLLTHPVVSKALSTMSDLVLTPIEEVPIEGVRRLLSRL